MPHQIYLSRSGLNGESVAASRERFGPNTLPQPKKRGPLKVFVGQFKDIMTVILLAAVVLSVLLGETAESISILCIVLLNSVMGFVQEYRTERALERLRDMAAPSTRVIRDGEEKLAPGSGLVVGDLVPLRAGDRIPADGVLVECAELQSDESMLTGESVPVSKRAAGFDEELLRLGRALGGEGGIPPHPAANVRVHMGCLVTRGRGLMLTEGVGSRTEMGRVAGMLREIEEGPTPLQKQLSRMGRWIAAGCLIVCAVVAFTGFLRGEAPLDMLLTGISLAVAAVPEGLPAIVTISLALAVGRVYKRGAWIKKLHAVESLGCATVICSDKTGTLTENRMTVQRLESGDPLLACELAALCSSGQIRRTGNGFTVSGDPTETALLAEAARRGVWRDELIRRNVTEHEEPFDSTRKRMSVVVRTPAGRRLYLKGAWEIVLSLCGSWWDGGTVRPLTAADRERWRNICEQMTSEALRVVAVAFRPLSAGEPGSEQALIFAGAFGMLDPPRREAAPAVRRCRRAGIRPVMITGDHIGTARAIAARVGIFRPGDPAFTGAELDRMDDAAFAEAARSASVFARVTPAHKLRLVRALRKEGQVVAMTGDGVNDAPAIKEADVGVAMGRSGTDVAREAAGVVLRDDSFATLVTAVEEGRAIYANIRKFIRYLLSCNTGEVLTMFAGMLLGLPVVLLPVQILLVNLVTDGLPALALGLEPPEPSVMDRPPRDQKAGVFAGGLGGLILFRGALIGAAALGVFLLLLPQGLAAARTGAFAALVLAQLMHVFECKSETRSLFTVPLLNNKKLLLAVFSSAVIVFSAIYLPALQPVFETVPLTPGQLLTVLGLCITGPVIGSVRSGIAAMIRRRKRGTSQNSSGRLSPV